MSDLHLRVCPATFFRDTCKAGIWKAQTCGAPIHLIKIPSSCYAYLTLSGFFFVVVVSSIPLHFLTH